MYLLFYNVSVFPIVFHVFPTTSPPLRFHLQGQRLLAAPAAGVDPRGPAAPAAGRRPGDGSPGLGAAAGGGSRGGQREEIGKACGWLEEMDET